MKRFIAALLACAGLISPSAIASDQPYAGQEDRGISTLSADDIRAIKAGEGWGLAKPAELNGWPGPRHVLDAADALSLTADQHARVEAIFTDMRAKAIKTGADYLAAEAALDTAFRSGEASAEEIARHADVAGAALAALRMVHLEAHLKTAPLLSRHQRAVYATLRGYRSHKDHGGHAKH